MEVKLHVGEVLKYVTGSGKTGLIVMTAGLIFHHIYSIKFHCQNQSGLNGLAGCFSQVQYKCLWPTRGWLYLTVQFSGVESSPVL